MGLINPGDGADKASTKLRKHFKLPSDMGDLSRGTPRFWEDKTVH